MFGLTSATRIYLYRGSCYMMSSTDGYILRHSNPNTTARYIRSLGLEETRGALEEGLKGPARVIEFQKVKAV